jgi:hypothetical protein
MKNRETDEWLKQNQRSTRNFIRKWGHFCKHDSLMKPIVPPKYDIGFILKENNIDILRAVEPWGNNIYCDTNLGNHYISTEQPNTIIDLSERVKSLNSEKTNDIQITIGGGLFNNQDFNYIQNLSEILADSGDVGTFKIGTLEITINSMETYENNLIINKQEEKTHE